MTNSTWKIVGASLTGRSHIANGTPCQDAHYFEELESMSGIVALCDGAGSHENSHIGAQFIAEKAVVRLKQQLEEFDWLSKDKVLSNEDWFAHVEELFLTLQDDLKALALKEDVSYKSLSCTLIVLLFSPHRLLTAHVGDGRAGYANEKGEWTSIINPFKGEQVGQTVFLTTDFSADWPYHVIESRVIEDTISAFTLMSDGCELGCWKCYDKYPEEERFYDPNQPDQKFFEQNVQALRSMYLSKVSEDDIKEKWKLFLENGNEVLRKETDDKTMILGVTFHQDIVDQIPDNVANETDY